MKQFKKDTFYLLFGITLIYPLKFFLENRLTILGIITFAVFLYITSYLVVKNVLDYLLVNKKQLTKPFEKIIHNNISKPSGDFFVNATKSELEEIQLFFEDILKSDYNGKDVNLFDIELKYKFSEETINDLSRLLQIYESMRGRYEYEDFAENDFSQLLYPYNDRYINNHYDLPLSFDIFVKKYLDSNNLDNYFSSKIDIRSLKNVKNYSDFLDTNNRTSYSAKDEMKVLLFFMFNKDILNKLKMELIYFPNYYILKNFNSDDLLSDLSLSCNDVDIVNKYIIESLTFLGIYKIDSILLYKIQDNEKYSISCYNDFAIRKQLKIYQDYYNHRIEQKKKNFG